MNLGSILVSFAGAAAGYFAARVADYTFNLDEWAAAVADTLRGILGMQPSTTSRRSTATGGAS